MKRFVTSFEPRDVLVAATSVSRSNDDTGERKTGNGNNDDAPRFFHFHSFSLSLALALTFSLSFASSFALRRDPRTRTLDALAALRASRSAATQGRPSP